MEVDFVARARLHPHDVGGSHLPHLSAGADDGDYGFPREFLTSIRRSGYLSITAEKHDILLCFGRSAEPHARQGWKVDPTEAEAKNGKKVCADLRKKTTR